MCKVLVDASGGEDGTHRTRLRAGSVASASRNALRGTSKGPNASDVGNLPGAQSHPTEAVQGNQTTKQTPTAGRQAIFSLKVVVRRHDEGDVIEIEPARVCSEFSKIAFFVGKIKGSAHVHRTAHKGHRRAPKGGIGARPDGSEGSKARPIVIEYEQPYCR